MKRPRLAKGFPETCKRLAECDIILWRHIISSTTPSPSSQRSECHHPPAGNPPSKRRSEVESYRLHLHHPKKGAKQTSTDCQSDQYWSPCEVVLVKICNQYWSAQRLVLVAKPAPHNITQPPRQSPWNKPLKSALHRREKPTNVSPRKTTNRKRHLDELQDQGKLTATSSLATPSVYIETVAQSPVLYLEC